MRHRSNFVSIPRPIGDLLVLDDLKETLIVVLTVTSALEQRLFQHSHKHQNKIIYIVQNFEFLFLGAMP